MRAEVGVEVACFAEENGKVEEARVRGMVLDGC